MPVDEKYPSVPPTAGLPLFFVVAAYYVYAPLLRMAGALHLGIFDQPVKLDFFVIKKKEQ